MLSAVQGTQLEVTGVANLAFKIGNRVIYHFVTLVENCSYQGDILMGTDLLERLHTMTLHWGFGSGRGYAILEGQQYPFIQTAGLLEGTSLAVRRVPKMKTKESNNLRLHALETLPPHSCTTLWVKAPDSWEGKTLIIEGARPNPSVWAARVVATVREGHVPISLANFQDREVALPVGTALGTVFPLQVDPAGEPQAPIHPTSTPGPQADLKHLTDDQRVKIQSLLDKYSGAVIQGEDDLGFCPLVEHNIDTGDNKPIATNQWRLPYSTKRLIQEHCQKMLEMDVIEPCASPWRSPVLLVKKPSGEFRFCVDFRGLNSVTKRDSFPMPRVETILESLKGNQYLSSLDIKSAYWTIPVAPGDRDKTAFATSDNIYRFKRLPFGLSTAPATFQRLIQTVLAGVLGKIAYAYLDDVIVIGKNFEEHVQNLEEILALFQGAGLKVSLDKCVFAKPSLKFLGHVVSPEGIQVDPDKVKAVREMKPPSTVKGVRQFLGLVSYYRNYVPRFSEKAAPLTRLTKKGAKFVWNPDQQEAFQDLKDSLTKAPVLIYPDFDKPFKVQTDASDIAIAGVLTQQLDNLDHPVSYFSRKLSGPELNYTTSEKEALAIVESVRHFTPYIYGFHFTIVTDHAPLRYIFKYKANVPRIARWSLLLSEYDFDLVYKPGKEHVVPDALSRSVNQITASTGAVQSNEKVALKEHEGQLNFNRERVRKLQLEDKQWGSILRSLEGSSIILGIDYDKYVLDQGCLFYYQDKGDEVIPRLVIPNTLKKEALFLSHDIQLGAHSAFLKTLKRAQSMFYWVGQTQDVKEYVKKCLLCQKKSIGGGLRGEMKALSPITKPMERVGIDIMGELGRTQTGNKYVFTIVDHFTRFTQAYALPKKDTNTVARALMDFICRYGVPLHITCDRGGENNSELMKGLCQYLKVKMHFCLRAQSNGLVERNHRSMKNILRGLVKDDPYQWDEQLPYAVLALNTAYHTSVGDTPFFLFHGRDATFPFSDVLQPQRIFYDTDSNYKSEVILRLNRAFESARRHSDEAHQANKARQKDPTKGVEIGDLVLLRDHQIERGPLASLQAKWTGPFRVLDRISDITIQIKPVYTNKRAQTVHINRLKPAFEGEKVDIIPPIEAQPLEEVEQDNQPPTPSTSQPQPSSSSEDEDDGPQNQLPQQQKYHLRSKGPVQSTPWVASGITRPRGKGRMRRS